MSRDTTPEDSSEESTAQNSSSADTPATETEPPATETQPEGASLRSNVDHRLYGAERITHQFADGPTQGLMTLRELRLLEHASKFDRSYRNTLYSLLDRRVEQFTQSEWPIIEDMFPEYASRVQEAVCGAES